MNPIVESLLSKKFGVVLVVMYFLYSRATVDTNNPLIYVYLMVGLAVFYCILDVIVSLISKPKENSIPKG